MEQLNPGTGSFPGTRERLKRVAMIALPAFIFIHLLNIALAPAARSRQYSQLVAADSTLLNAYDPVIDHPSIKPLVYERAWKESLLSLAGNDSISLGINIPDTTVRLFIEGVTIHRSHIGEVKVGRLLEDMPALQVIELFSAPLKVERIKASIVKEPVTVMHAPTDTVDIEAEEWQPDTLLRKPVFVMMELQHGIRVLMLQEENSSLRFRTGRALFRTGLWLEDQARNIVSTLTLRRVRYTSRLVMRLPAGEITALYRALPDKALVVFSP